MILSYLYGKLLNRIRGKCIKASVIDKTSVVGTGCNVVRTVMNRFSYCGDDCQIVNTEIGAFCSISDHVFIGGAEHPLDWVSTSPVFQNVRNSGPRKRFAKIALPNSERTIIGNDVWIGHGATIKQGVIIGHGAVIGSNALVTKDIPPYAIVGGVPARIIKYRFDEDVINKLLETKWWMAPEETLSAFSHYFNDCNAFIEKYLEES